MNLPLTKISETSTKITLGWTPVPGAVGYRFQSSTQAPKWSHTFDPTRDRVTFSKADWYKVEALGVSASGEFPVTAPPPPPPPPGGAYWIGDFRDDAQDFSDFDMHDTRTNVFNDWAVGQTRDVTIVPKPAGSKWPNSTYMCRVICNNDNPSNSQSGQTVNLWEPGAYGEPWVRGRTVWCRAIVVIPDGRDSRYPGKMTPVGGDGVHNRWHTFVEWHKNDGAGAPGPTSTQLGIGWGQAGPAWLLKQIGGSSSITKMRYLYETDQVQTEANGAGGTTGPIGGNFIPLKFNHEYDLLFRWVLDPDPAVGRCDWYVDGNLRAQMKTATMFQKSDGSVPGLSFQAGIYRNFPTWAGNVTPTTDENEHLYVVMMGAGPTRASMGA